MFISASLRGVLKAFKHCRIAEHIRQRTEVPLADTWRRHGVRAAYNGAIIWTNSYILKKTCESFILDYAIKILNLQDKRSITRS
ncbi:hypothetical protein ScPMuIL_004242 [Solemya velum]